MKLSIITINYNNCDGLKKTIDSVKSQTFTDYEWIVIDGGSTDGSKELLEENASYFSYWCSESDNGIYSAMNKGITHIHGEYVHFLNSGDWLFSPDTYKSIFQQSILFGDILYSNCSIYWNDEWSYFQRNVPENEITPSFFLQKNLNHQNVIIKSNLVQGYPYDESYSISADYKSYLIYLLNGKRFQYLDLVIANFDGNGYGSTNNTIRQQQEIAIQKELFPNSVLLELQKLTTYKQKEQFITRRKLFRIIMRTAYHFCQRLDPILLTIDKKRHH